MSAVNELGLRAPDAPARSPWCASRRRAADLIDRSMAGFAGPAATPLFALVQAAVEAAPASERVRINPTKRTLRFVVPLNDGETYLGDVDLAVAPDDTLSVAAPRLIQLLEPLLKPDGLARLKAVVASGASLSAAQLAGLGIGLDYDSQKLILAIRIPVPARRQSSVSLRNRSDQGAETLQPASFSAYVNLRSAVDVIERGEGRGFVAPVSLVDGAVRAFGVVAESEAYVSLRRDEPRVRRTGSRLVYDDLVHTLRWSLGDVRPFSRNFQSSPVVAGLSVSRFYNILDPQREVRSSGAQGFSLFGASTVETVVNGRVVERKLLQPGSYTLQDFPLAEGGNDVRLNIQDETGKRRTIEFSLYSNQALLEPGATELAGFAGVYATPTRSGIAYGRTWTTQGFVRRGFSQQFTAGVNLQADRRAQQAGTELLFGTGFGLLGVDLSASRRTSGGNGFASAIRIEKIVQDGSAGRSQSVRALVEYRSARFAIPGALVPVERLLLRASGGYSVTFGRDLFAALDGQFARDRIERRSNYSIRASGGFRLIERLALVSEAELRRGRDTRGLLFRIGLRQRFGERASAQLDVDSRGTARASLQDSGGRGVGAWSGSVDVSRDRSTTALNAAATLATNRADFGFEQGIAYDAATHRVGPVRSAFRAATSIAFADGGFAIGRPVQDAFLIAAPHRSLNGKSVRLDPQDKSEEAHSDAFGAGLEGSLSAYSKRTIVYAVPDAPPGYDLGQGNVELRPPYRGGYRLEVGSDYHLLVLGRLLDPEGDPVTLLAGKAIDLKAPKRPAVTMFTSRGGKFGVQGLRPGKWRIEMPTEPPTIYEIEVRDDPSGTVRLGDVRPVEQGRGER